MMDEEQQLVANGLKEMTDLTTDYYPKVSRDLLYESGSTQTDNADGDVNNEDNDAGRLMFLRKNINRVVNPVILNNYSVHVEPKDEINHLLKMQYLVMPGRS